MQIEVKDREGSVVELMIWALKADMDDYGLAQSNIVNACQDFIKNYGDVAQGKRWMRHAKNLQGALENNQFPDVIEKKIADLSEKLAA